MPKNYALIFHNLEGKSSMKTKETASNIFLISNRASFTMQ